MGDQPLSTTPLDGWHRANGGRMVGFEGWQMPLQYGAGILAEHLATRKFGGAWDVSHMGRIRIGGDDRVAFLQHVLSNNVEALGPWEAQYTLIPAESGGVVDDAYLYRFGEADYLLVVNASNHAKDLAHLHAHAARFGQVTLEDHTDAVAMFAVQGPSTGEVLEELADGYLPEPQRNACAPVRLAGIEVLVARTGYTGEPIGFELFVPASGAEKVWSRVLEAGTERGIVPCGLGVRDTLRTEAGLPLFGHEFGIDPEGNEFPAFSFPLSSLAVSFSRRKGDFVGRGALRDQFEQAKLVRTGGYEPSPVLPRRTQCVAILDPGVARQGSRVLAGDRPVGFVTSGTMVPYWEFAGEGATMQITERSQRRAVALACLEATVAPGDDLVVEVRGRRLRARTVPYHGRSEAPPYFRSIPADRLEQAEPPVVQQGVARAQDIVERAVDNHHWRQERTVNLIPSEMTQSPMVRMLQVSDPAGRYAEHRELLAAFEQEVFYYQGTDFIAWVEDQVAAEIARFLNCTRVESRAVSGQMANMTVFGAMVDWRNRVDRRREPERIRLAVTNHIGKGGHLSSQPMGALRDYLAKDPVTERFAVRSFPVRHDDPYRIDLDATAQLLSEIDPELIVLGKSMVLHPEPVAAVKAMISGKQSPPILMYDMAHVLGLVGPHFQEPFSEGADLVTGSTHKTFFGPQRGVIAGSFEENTNLEELWRAIRRRAFPGMVSNHHLGTLVGLLFASVEMNTFKEEYQPQVIANAKAMARALAAEGLRVEGDEAVGYTETHQVLIDVGHARGPEVARHLEDRNIITNYQALPHDEGFTAASGLRLGVAEMTRFGLTEPDFEELAGLFAAALRDEQGIGEAVADFRGRFRELRYCFDPGSLGGAAERLLKTL